MPSYAIAIDLSHVLEAANSPISGETFPNLAHAVDRIVHAAHDLWTAYAHGAALPDGKVIQNRTGEYARSILTRQIGDYSGEVYSELPYAQAIEEGSPARDMKKMLNTSLKVRLTKDGRRYLIIPFRHNSPDSVLGNNMPQAVADWWKQGGASASSSITGSYRRTTTHFRDAAGVMHGVHDLKTRQRISVPGWRYKWGDRLHADDLVGMRGVSAKQAKRLEGMVNFRNPGGAGNPAAGSHSQYLTFRMMVEGSRGWIAPAQPGKFPARTTADTIRPIAEEAFKAGMASDIKAILG